MRPQTYENKEEAKVLSYVFSGQSGLENTSFALLTPSGKKITRGSRSPSMTYGSTEAFAEALQETAERYAKKAKPIQSLPVLSDLRLALNVAAADMRPLVVVRGKDAKDAARLSKEVAKLAWSADVVGQCHYVVLSETVTFEKLEPKVGVSVIQPDPYGLGGKVLSHASATKKSADLTAAVAKGLAAHAATDRDHSDHIREARRKGITWESEIPVTDSGASRKGRRR